MNRHIQPYVALLLIGLTISTGCSPTQPFYFSTDHDLSHYLDKATDIEYPDVHTEPLADATESVEPLTVSNPEFKEMWDLKLEEAVAITLQNSKILRSLGALTQIGYANSGQERGIRGSVYDPALTETSGSSRPQATLTSDSRYSAPSAGASGGVESALAEFDAVWSITGSAPYDSGAWMTKRDRPQNRTSGTLFPTMDESTYGGLRTSLAKKTASGALFTVSNLTNYDRFDGNMSSNYSRALRSDWTTSMEIRWDQPVLRGGGVLSGLCGGGGTPFSGPGFHRIPIILARINTDISIADFESQVRDVMLDVENTYWDLHRAYRRLETTKTGRDSAQVTWRIVYEKWNQGVEPVQAEAQAREQYFNFRAQVEAALKEVYDTESHLRFLMGIAATDGRLIRPIDEPTIARVDFDWAAIRVEALIRSPELRKHKWQLKQRELEVIAARNHLLPQLDVGAVYRWVGLGDDLIKADRSTANYPAVGSTAFQELTEGNYQEFAFTFNFSLPVGLRRELAEVRHRQLMLARQKAILEDMELTTTHILTNDVRNLDSTYVMAQTHFNRLSASEKEVESVNALYKGGKTAVDLVLEAQRRRAQAQQDYYNILIEYQKAIAKVHYIKGSLFEYNNVHLSEGPWPQKAYWDALGRARERDASYYLDYGCWPRRPAGVVSTGSSEFSPASASISDGVMFEGAMMSPQPTPAGRRLPQPPRDEAAPQDVPLPEPGPVTSQPGPLLSDPSVRTASAGAAPGDLPLNPLRNAFEWGSLGIDGKAGASQVQQAGFVSDVPAAKRK